MKDQIAAIYCRLSKEDLDKDLGKTVSESIKNQRAMLETYALEHHWMIYDFYIDEDYSGSDRHRPEFNRLITDSLLGHFNIVLCKKQARFARDIEYVERYIHGLFVERQIRFVAVLDNIDTGEVNRSARKASQINSLVDEWYLSDLSENIISSLTVKRKNAEFIGSWAPYGYRKDPNNKNALLIDPDAANIVREVFQLYSKGYGITAIAQELNAKRIENPLTYKHHKGEKINPNPEKRTTKSHLWTPCTISTMLHNQTYIGDLVQGKYKKASYKSKKLLRVSKSDWIIIPNCHEQIIDQETWAAVQKNLNARSRVSTGRKRHHLLAGKAYCGECGAKLVSSGGRSGKRRVTYLCCSNHNLSKEACIGSRIETSKLEEVVLSRINTLSSQFFDEAYLLSHVDFDRFHPKSRKAYLTAELQTVQSRINMQDTKNEMLYTDKLDGILTHDQFITFQNKLIEETASLQLEHQKLEIELSHIETHQVNSISETEILNNYRISHQLTQEMVNELIDSIFVYRRIKGEPQKIKINWDF